MMFGHQQLLTCFLLVLFPSYKAARPNFEKGKIDGQKHALTAPQSESEEGWDEGRRVSFKNRYADEPDVFNALKENLRLSDDQENILKGFSQSPSNVVPDSTRYISEFIRSEINEIEKDVTLPLKNMLPFDETSKEFDEQGGSHHSRDKTKVSQDDRRYGPGKLKNQGERHRDVTDNKETNHNVKDKGNGKKRPRHDIRKIAPTKIGAKDNENQSSKHPDKGETGYTIERNKEDLESRVTVRNNKYRNNPDASDSNWGSPVDLEELRNLVVNSKQQIYGGESSTVDDFSIKKDNVTKAPSQYGKLDTTDASYANVKLQQMPQNYLQDWSYKNDLRFKRANTFNTEEIQNKKNADLENKDHIKVTVDDDDTQLKKLGIFEHIADAFAHIDKTKKEYEMAQERKKSMLEGIRKVNANQPVNGGFTPWTDWSECSETCGKDAIRMRTRVCTNPSPANGGKDCEGWRFEVKYCELPNCNETMLEKKRKSSSTKVDFQNQRKEIEERRQGIQKQQHHTTVHNASNEKENTNKTTENIQHRETNTNNIIQKMFKDVIHKAFEKSKNYEERKENININKTAPIVIHTDSGLIASESEVDTIDDAPDTSQDIESKLQESQASQDMESERQASQSMQDMASEGSAAIEDNKENISSRKDQSSQDVNVKKLEKSQPAKETENSQSPKDGNVKESDESQSPKDGNVKEESEDSQSPKDGNVKESDESQSPKDGNVKESEDSQSPKEDNVKESEDSQSPKDGNVKESEDSQSPKDGNVKESEDSQSPKDGNVKESEDSQSPKDGNVKESEDSQSPKDGNVKDSDESQSPKDGNVKESDESQSPKDGNVKESDESQSPKDDNVKESEDSLSPKDGNVKEYEDSQSPKNGNVKESDESLSPKDGNVEESEDSQSPKDGNVKESDESQSPKDGNVKESEDSQSPKDGNVKESEDSQSPKDGNVKESEDSQSPKDDNVEESEDSQSPKDGNVKESEDSQSPKEGNVEESEDSQSPKDGNVKESEDSQSPKDGNVKESDESQYSLDTHVNQAEKGKSSQDANVNQADENQSSQDSSVDEDEESQIYHDGNVVQGEEGHFSQNANVNQAGEGQSSQSSSSNEAEESQIYQDINANQDDEGQSSQNVNVNNAEEGQSEDGSINEADGRQISQDANDNQESQYFQDANDKHPIDSGSYKDTDINETEENQSSQEDIVNEDEESPIYQNTNVHQAEVSQYSQEANDNQVEEVQSSQVAKEKQDSQSAVKDIDSKTQLLSKSEASNRGDSSKKPGQAKTNYSSIDGNYDMVTKTDEEDLNFKDKKEDDISKMASEILKNNDTYAVLKALSDVNTELLNDTSSRNKVSIGPSNENIDGSYPAINNHGEANSVLLNRKDKNNNSNVRNLAKGSHTNTDKQTLNEHTDQTKSGRDQEIKNSPGKIKVGSHEDANKNTISGVESQKYKDISEPSKRNNKLKKETKKNNTTKKETVQDGSKNQGKLDTTIDYQADQSEANQETYQETDQEPDMEAGQESLSRQKQSDVPAASIDWGNVHALNALVEVLAEHEKNTAAKNDIATLRSNATIDRNAKTSDTAKEAHTNNTKAMGYENDTMSLAEKDDNRNYKDKYVRHGGENRRNVTGEGNVLRNSNLTVKGNKQVGQTEGTDNLFTKKDDKEDKHSATDMTHGSLIDATKNQTNQDPLLKLIKVVMMNFRSSKIPKNATKLDESKRKNNGTSYTSWTAWNTCTRSCGQGTRTRTRKCLLDTKTCDGPLDQTESCGKMNCADHGGFTEWTAWSSCSATCGKEIFKSRSRSCIKPVAFKDKSCKGPLTEQKKCNLKHCVAFEIAGKVGNETLLPNSAIQAIPKEKGLWGPWSSWSRCTATCGGEGVSSRERFCLPRKKCTGPRFDTKECGADPCPVDGGYTEWSNWSSCTPSCGPRAYRLRSRNCTNPPPSYGGKKCFDSALETEPCKINCPVDGGYSAWSSWSTCTKTCNTSSLSRRERECTRPTPKYGGKPCKGVSEEIRHCGKQPCPVNGGLSNWSSWTPCLNLSCGTRHFTTRRRSCNNPRPQFGGKTCTEVLFEKKSCQYNYCPVHGGFSSWSVWSACPQNCKIAGVSHRRRECNNPKPKHGGRVCVGPRVEAKPCSDTCRVDGGFTEWTAWSKCSRECGRTSIKSRERYCTNPKPANGGKKCKGARFQISICKNDGCPVNGNYTKWSSWTKCPRCGFGVMSRQRTCTNPPPTNGGKDCVGPEKEGLACPFRACRNGGFGQWSKFGQCSKSCGGGTKMRRRICEDESKGCDGKFIQLQPCNVHSCILSTDHLVSTNPMALCGFNPCQISRCLGYPQAMCLTSSSCWPVFFDKKGNILESCKGDMAVLSSPPEMICQSDPCRVSGCYTDEASSCHVSTRCKPVFLDSSGKKLDCRGLLKVPPITVCGDDPCEGKSCDLDNSAQCVSDYNCSPVFISAENEILSKCKVNKYRDNSYIINSKAGGKSYQTNQEIEYRKSQLRDFLKNGDTNDEKVETITEYTSEDNPSLTAEQHNDLEDKLENLKRSRLYKPKIHHR